ncbi:spore germination protein PD [Paenibacillus wynnii]|nr:spore germination protein PD [Paenibacillus wynnii]
MNLTVVNKKLNMSAVKVISISGSSVLLVGDAQNINCSSVCDSRNSPDSPLPDKEN